MALTSLLEKLTQELALTMPVIDAKGQYRLNFEEDQVVFYELNPGVALYCEVAKCTPNGQEALFAESMWANLFGQGTQGAVLGLTPDGKLLTLSLEIDYNVEYKDFKNTLEDFLNAVEVWRVEATKADNIA